MKLIDKEFLTNKIKERIERYSKDKDLIFKVRELNHILSLIDESEVKDIVASKECICQQMYQRLVGDNWILQCPTNSLKLKQGDKVNIVILKKK